MTAAKSNHGNDDLLNMSRAYDRIGTPARDSERVEVQSEVVGPMNESKKDSFKRNLNRGTLTFGSEGVQSFHNRETYASSKHLYDQSDHVPGIRVVKLNNFNFVGRSGHLQNYISSRRYSWASFLPVVLFNHFKYFQNMLYLLIGLS